MEKCRGCGKDLLLVNRYTIADGCPCNRPRGINHGIVPKATCTCTECDPAQTGSVRTASCELRDVIGAMTSSWRNKANESRDEAERIRRTMKALTDAEMRCRVRAEVWSGCACDLEIGTIAICGLFAELECPPAAGTMCCPICGRVGNHSHSPTEIDEWVKAQATRFGRRVYTEGEMDFGLKQREDLFRLEVRKMQQHLDIKQNMYQESEDEVVALREELAELKRKVGA